MARSVLALLAAASAAIVVAGVVAAPLLVDVLYAGFSADKRDLTVRLVRIIFPGIGILVLSAWCLGVLNSHGRFLLSYAAPVAWNLAIIAAAVAAAPARGPAELVVVVAWGAVIGSILQLVVQLPGVWRLLRPAAGRGGGEADGVRTVLGNFGPAVLSRGVVQVSGWVDMLIASFLGTGAVAALANAQLLATLPVGVFGMSISASELPAMAAATGREGAAAAIRERLEEGWRRIAFYVVPCAAAFLALGHVVSGTVFESGAFTAADSGYVWMILAGAALGLLATTAARHGSSAFFALGDTRTPLRYAVVRVVVGMGLGLLLGLVLPGRLGLDPRVGAAGLTLAGSVAGWVEFALIRRALAARIGPALLGSRYLGMLGGLAGLAAGAAWLTLVAGPVAAWPPLWRGLVVLAVFGAVYLGLTWLARIPEARWLASRRSAHG